MQFLWPTGFLSQGAILGGGKNQASPGVLAVIVAFGAHGAQILPQCMNIFAFHQYTACAFGTCFDRFTSWCCFEVQSLGGGTVRKRGQVHKRGQERIQVQVALVPRGRLKWGVFERAGRVVTTTLQWLLRMGATSTAFSTPTKWSQGFAYIYTDGLNQPENSLFMGPQTPKQVGPTGAPPQPPSENNTYVRTAVTVVSTTFGTVSYFAFHKCPPLSEQQ